MLTASPYWCWHRVEESGTNAIVDHWPVAKGQCSSKCVWMFMYESIGNVIQALVNSVAKEISIINL